MFRFLDLGIFISRLKLLFLDKIETTRDDMVFRRSINNNEKADIDIDCSKKWIRERGTHTKLLCGFDSDEDPDSGDEGEGTIGLVLDGIGKFKTDSLVELLQKYMKDGEIVKLREKVDDSDIAGLYNFANFNQMDGPSELFNNARELVIDKFMKMLFDKTMENRGEELHENLEEFVTNLPDLVIGNEIINTIFKQAYDKVERRILMGLTHIVRIILYPRKQLSRAMNNNRIDPAIHSKYLVWAALSGNTETARMFLAWEGEDGRRLDPISGVSISVYIWLLREAPDPTTPTENISNIAIREASLAGHVEIVRMLLAWEDQNGSQVDPTVDDNCAIRNASQDGRTEIVRMLLAWEGRGGQRIDPTVNIIIRHTVNDNYAIRMASANGHTEIVRLLLAWEGPGPRVDPTVNEAIRDACRRGQTEIVRMLLAWEGPDGQRVDPTTDGNRAIHYASRNGHSEIVSMLRAWEGGDGLKVTEYTFD